VLSSDYRINVRLSGGEIIVVTQADIVTPETAVLLLKWFYRALVSAVVVIVALVVGVLF